MPKTQRNKYKPHERVVLVLPGVRYDEETPDDHSDIMLIRYRTSDGEVQDRYTYCPQYCWHNPSWRKTQARYVLLSEFTDYTYFLKAIGYLGFDRTYIYTKHLNKRPEYLQMTGGKTKYSLRAARETAFALNAEDIIPNMVPVKEVGQMLMRQAKQWLAETTL